MPGLDFLVRRGDLRDTRLEASSNADNELEPGQVLLQVDRFGFSANNVTYALMGEAMGYWRFFPGPEGWGRIPVWGYADVIASAHDAVPEGRRVFGYLPMSTRFALGVEPTDTGFKRSPMLEDLASVYQRYMRADDPRHEPAREDLEALWRPLFITSFGAADYLLDKDLFEAEAVVLSSASSKTSLGTAYLLATGEPRRAEVVALTSPGNSSFCERLGYYDRVVTYDEVTSLPQTPTAFVDVGGSERVRRDLRNHLGDSLKQTVIVGAAQWEDLDPTGGLGDADSQFFFLPQWMNQRHEAWGRGVFMSRYAEAWERFLPSLNDWMKVIHAHGPDAVEQSYRELLEGKTSPEIGHILSLTAH